MASMRAPARAVTLLFLAEGYEVTFDAKDDAPARGYQASYAWLGLPSRLVHPRGV